MNNPIDAMKDQQRREHLTDEQFTVLLGVHRTTWAKVKSGQRKPGLKLLSSFDRHFPHVNIFNKDIFTTTPGKASDGKWRCLFPRLISYILKTLKRG